MSERKEFILLNDIRNTFIDLNGIWMISQRSDHFITINDVELMYHDRKSRNNDFLKIMTHHALEEEE